MAKKALLINKVSGGLNSYSDPRDLKENEFQILDNACVDEEGVIRVSGAFNSTNYIEGLDILGDITPSYTSLPIAGKGFYTFITETKETIINDNPYLDVSGDTAWGVTTVDNDSTWLFGQTSTYNTNIPIGGISNSEKVAINYVNIVQGNAHYQMGNIKTHSMHLKPGVTYRATLGITSDTPWYYLGGNIPPRIRIYNDVESKYLMSDGTFSSTSDATHNSLLRDSDGSVAFADNGNLAGFIAGTGSGTYDWAAAGSPGAFSDLGITTVEFAVDDDEKRFNAIFGGSDVAASGSEGGFYNVLNFKTESSTENNWFSEDGHYFQMDDITVEANTTYLFDFFINRIPKIRKIFMIS